jgi:peptide/nickel transport system permease protein
MRSTRGATGSISDEVREATMLKFFIRRLAHGVVVLWIISVLIFSIFFVAPSNVAQTLAGRQATPQTVALIKARLGLDDPLYHQYGRFVWNALHGDLGYDYYHGRPVTGIILDAVPKTLSLALGAAVLWLALGVFNGVVSARHPRSIADRSLTVFSLFFYSMPSFLLGLLLLYTLYFRLTVAGHAWFPAGGYVPLTEDPGQWFRCLVLPWLTLALVYAATYTRLTRGSMLDVLGEDYIRTARSKGMGERRVIYRHGLRSALTPVVTQFGIDLGGLIGGAVITEFVFSIDGLGRESIIAINQQDLPVIVGIALFASAVVVVANILVDMAYAVLDPRVRLH